MNEMSFFYWIKKCIQHPVYFVFCFAVGLCAWSFSFEFKKPIAESLQFSLQTHAHNELRFNEEKVINRLPASAATKPKKKLPKRFRSNPAFQLFEKLKEVAE
ncbi:MAG: hypothetical protein ABL930_01950 [Pseudobdellovibrio sp.]